VIVLTTDFADLVFHAFAHVPVADHTSLFDRRYVAWAAERTPASCSPFVEDAGVLAQRWASLADTSAIQVLPILHSSIDEFLSTATLELRGLDASHVASEGALRTLRAVDETLVELLRADLALAARSYASFFAARIEPELTALIEPMRAITRPLAAHLPGSIELSSALGVHGRALSDRIVVGAPLPWVEIEPASPIVLALHEHLVRSSVAAGADRYAVTEWDALVRGAEIMRTAPAELATAHARWLEALALAPLLDRVVECGLLDRARATRIAEGRQDRVALLRDAR
jgi:hypothetical protein